MHSQTYSFLLYFNSKQLLNIPIPVDIHYFYKQSHEVSLNFIAEFRVKVLWFCFLEYMKKCTEADLSTKRNSLYRIPEFVISNFRIPYDDRHRIRFNEFEKKFYHEFQNLK